MGKVRQVQPFLVYMWGKWRMQVKALPEAMHQHREDGEAGNVPPNPAPSQDGYSPPPAPSSQQWEHIPLVTAVEARWSLAPLNIFLQVLETSATRNQSDVQRLWLTEWLSFLQAAPRRQAHVGRASPASSDRRSPPACPLSSISEGTRSPCCQPGSVVSSHSKVRQQVSVSHSFGYFRLASRICAVAWLQPPHWRQERRQPSAYPAQLSGGACFSCLGAPAPLYGRD